MRGSEALNPKMLSWLHGPYDARTASWRYRDGIQEVLGEVQELHVRTMRAESQRRLQVPRSSQVMASNDVLLEHRDRNHRALAMVAVLDHCLILAVVATP